jgi:hypothetical protein
LKKFKSDWQITENWQLLFPLIGIAVLFYSAIKLTSILVNDSIVIASILAIPTCYVFVRTCVWIINKLESKWVVRQKWELIRIFIVFAITGSSSVIVGRPIIKFLGITTENLPALIYWILFIAISLIFYQILLIVFGWLFGQFEFFWNFEKKMLRRFGIKL